MTDPSYDPYEHPLSASKLKTAAECPEKFLLKYIQRLDGITGDPHYLEIGNAVHWAIEEVLAEAMHDAAMDAMHAPAQYHEGRKKTGLKTAFMAALDDVIALEGEYVGYDDRDDPFGLDSDQREVALDCLDAAATYIADRQPNVQAVEMEVDFAVDHLQNAPWTGYADVITSDPGEIWDWKTGKSEGKQLDENLQGATYLAGYVEAFGEVPDAIRFIYLKEGKVRDYTPDEYDDMMETLYGHAETLLAMADRDEFPGRPDSANCHYCDYERACTSSPCGVGNVNWRDYP